MTAIQHFDPASVDWAKGGGLVPAIVQDELSGAVLMMAYMNPDALAATLRSGRVTFWSRSRRALWTKGESSGNHLDLRGIAVDCDGDTLLITAAPNGPACHLGTRSCWGEHPPRAGGADTAFLTRLEDIVAERLESRPAGSYTASLLAGGVRRIAQKVGEEALELALAAVDQPDEEVIAEAADLLYHTVLLLKARGLSLAAVCLELERRHAERSASPGAPAAG